MAWSEFLRSTCGICSLCFAQFHGGLCFRDKEPVPQGQLNVRGHCSVVIMCESQHRRALLATSGSHWWMICREKKAAFLFFLQCGYKGQQGLFLGVSKCPWKRLAIAHTHVDAFWSRVLIFFTVFQPDDWFSESGRLRSFSGAARIIQISIFDKCEQRKHLRGRETHSES